MEELVQPILTQQTCLLGQDSSESRHVGSGYEFLLARWDCESCSNTHPTIFKQVVRNGEVRAVQSMLADKAVGPDDTTGTQTPLLVAASKGHMEIMQLLLDNGANVNALPIRDTYSGVHTLPDPAAPFSLLRESSRDTGVTL